MVTNRANLSAVKRLPLQEKARILRAERGSISGIARDLGKSHATVSLILSGKIDASEKWVKPFLSAIDRKVLEILRRGSK